MTNEYRARPIKADAFTITEVLAELPDTGIELNMIAFREENERRAHFAATAVYAYAGKTGITTGESVFLAVGDLLTDLLHLLDACRDLNEDENYPRELEEALAQARRRYYEEITGDR